MSCFCFCVLESDGKRTLFLFVCLFYFVFCFIFAHPRVLENERIFFFPLRELESKHILLFFLLFCFRLSIYRCLLFCILSSPFSLCKHIHESICLCISNCHLFLSSRLALLYVSSFIQNISLFLSPSARYSAKNCKPRFDQYFMSHFRPYFESYVPVVILSNYSTQC